MQIQNHVLAAAAAAALMLAPLAAANPGAYPDKPIRMIVGYPPAGGADIMARLVTDPLIEKLGTQIIIDNRPGAGSATATGIAAKATPDGYTLLFATTSFVINPNLYKRVPYDPIKDFVPISKVASVPFVVIVKPSLPAKSMKELLDLARAKPGELNYATGGNGSTGHLAGELLKSMTGANIQHIPYKGLAPALADLLGGRVDMSMSSLPSCVGFIKSGKLRALAVTTEKRTPLLSNTPTVAEAGVAGYEVEQWYGVFAPSGTPAPIIGKINAALASTLAKPTPALLERFSGLGASPTVSQNPAAFAAYVKANLAFWDKAVRQANAKVE